MVAMLDFSNQTHFSCSTKKSTSTVKDNEYMVPINVRTPMGTIFFFCKCMMHLSWL